jgi:hypothetical protein
MTENSLEAGERAAAAVAKTENRVSLESMMAKIVDVEFSRSALCPELTIAVVKLANGFSLVGKSACADPANYNKELGEKFAKEDALRQMWPLEGYALRERLAG